MRYTIALSLASLFAAAPALRAEVPVVVTDIGPVHALVAGVMGDLGAPVLLWTGARMRMTSSCAPVRRRRCRMRVWWSGSGRK
jgi:ABC-type Zn2+ transport system substrate-binding protein/surface adhesin